MRNRKEKRMWEKLEYALLLGVALTGIVLMSCASLLDEITPADIPMESLEYAGYEPNEVGFYSLKKARTVLREVVTIHRDRLLDWEYNLKREQFLYEAAKGYLEPAIQEAREFQELLIGSAEQPLSILGLMTYLGFGGAGTLMGKNLLKRKKDYTPEEYAIGIEKAKNGAGKENS